MDIDYHFIANMVNPTILKDKQLVYTQLLDHSNPNLRNFHNRFWEFRIQWFMNIHNLCEGLNQLSSMHGKVAHHLNYVQKDKYRCIETMRSSGIQVLIN